MPKARVLAVDDQRYFRELIEGLLTDEGYEVHTASSGSEALHVLGRDDFDVVVTDLVMPEMDGTQLVERIKERVPDQDIVMVTGVVDVKAAVEAMKQGATDYILKPVDRKALARSLSSIMQRRRLRDEHTRLMAENLEYMEVLSLYERATGLFSTLNLEPLAERLIEGLCLETSAQGGVLWVAETPGESRFRLVGVRGIIRVDEEPTEIVLHQLGAELDELALGQAVLRPWARRREVDSGPDPRDGVALYVPLLQGGTLLGIARLSDKLEGEAFDDRDRAAAEKFGGLGATAVVNALRFRSVERRSFRDPATKAYTHAYFQDGVRNEIQKAMRFGHAFSIIRIDTGPLGELRSQLAESRFDLWLEDLVHHMGSALRATDLLACESERSYSVLLPETDALGAAILAQRILATVRETGVLSDLPAEPRPELTVAAVTYPSDGTQLEFLERVLKGRLEEANTSLLRTLDLWGQSFGSALESLLEQGRCETSDLPLDVARFAVAEAARRPRDRALLFVSPGPSWLSAVQDGLAALTRAETHTDIVLVADSRDRMPSPSPVACVSPERVGSDRPFLLYYGDGVAYAMVTADKLGDGGLRFFHTSDRALVEHLAFKLQRDLGIPLST